MTYENFFYQQYTTRELAQLANDESQLDYFRQKCENEILIRQQQNHNI